MKMFFFSRQNHLNSEVLHALLLEYHSVLAIFHLIFLALIAPSLMLFFALFCFVFLFIYRVCALIPSCWIWKHPPTPPQQRTLQAFKTAILHFLSAHFDVFELTDVREYLIFFTLTLSLEERPSRLLLATLKLSEAICWTIVRLAILPNCTDAISRSLVLLAFFFPFFFPVLFGILTFQIRFQNFTFILRNFDNLPTILFTSLSSVLQVTWPTVELMNVDAPTGSDCNLEINCSWRYVASKP